MKMGVGVTAVAVVAVAAPRTGCTRWCYTPAALDLCEVVLDMQLGGAMIQGTYMRAACMGAGRWEGVLSYQKCGR